MIAYTSGKGRMFCSLKGYFPCHDAEEVIREAGYDPEGDMENPTGSVFCSHGAGFVVNWDQVEDYMHLESCFPAKKGGRTQEKPVPLKTSGDWKAETEAYWKNEKELTEIFERTYGPIRKQEDEGVSRRKGWKRRHRESSLDGYAGGREATRYRENTPEKQYLLVDGYNIIFAWEDLQELAKANIDGARTKLMDILCNYQGYKRCTVILVFDAYKVQGNPGKTEKYHNIHVVYTKEAETADQYIEKTVHEIGKKYHVTVATSDRLEQVIILGQGGSRMSARELREEIDLVMGQIRQETENRRESGKNYFFDGLDEETARYMEDVRLGRKEE